MPAGPGAYGPRELPRGEHARTGPRTKRTPAAEITLGLCAWPEETTCCKQRCHTKWTTRAVQTLRRTCSAKEVDTTTRLAFVTQRHKHEKFGDKNRVYWLDNPHFLELNEPASTPDRANLVKTCMKFFLWATATSSNLSHGEVHREQNGPLARKRIRPDTKWAHARQWLKEEGEVADQQPDSNHLHFPIVLQSSGSLSFHTTSMICVKLIS